MNNLPDLDPYNSPLLNPQHLSSAVTFASRKIVRFTEEELQDPNNLYTFRVGIILLNKFKYELLGVLTSRDLTSIYQKLNSMNKTTIPTEACEEIGLLVRYLKNTLAMPEN